MQITFLFSSSGRLYFNGRLYFFVLFSFDILLTVTILLCQRCKYLRIEMVTNRNQEIKTQLFQLSQTHTLTHSFKCFVNRKVRMCSHILTCSYFFPCSAHFTVRNIFFQYCNLFNSYESHVSHYWLVLFWALLKHDPLRIFPF